MKVLFFIVFLLNISYYLFAEDTLHLNENVVLINNISKYSTLNDVKLIDNNKLFYGYFIIQIDSNSTLENFINGGTIFKTSIFWVDNLDSIDNNSSRYYYTPILGILADCVRSYDNGKRDELSSFVYYYNLFNYNNRPKKISYLYPYSDQFLTTNLIINSNTLKLTNRLISYVIYEVSFYTAVIYNSRYNVKSFIPISDLLTFSKINEKDIEKFGFSKSNLVILKN